jgi:hypothetical protein
MKKVKFLLFIIIFSLNIRDCISSEDICNTPFLQEQENSIRRRHFVEQENIFPKTDNIEFNKKKSLIIDLQEDVFDCLGIGWDLFKKRKYNESFNHIYLLSKMKNYQAQYLLGRFYEYGLGDTQKDLKSSYDLYFSVFVNSENDSLKSMSEEGIARTLKQIQSSFI